MPDRGWKQFERRVARMFGGERRGPDTTDPSGGGKSDVVGVPGFAIECGVGRTYTTYAPMLAKARQAERNANDGEMPVAVLKAPRIADANALVVMRLPTFLDWFGPGGDVDRAVSVAVGGEPMDLGAEFRSLAREIVEDSAEILEALEDA